MEGTAPTITATEALQRLREGNRRFVAGTRGRGPIEHRRRRGELVGGQAPFAIVLGCSDSRVPPEVIFDQGLGDLFTVRVAGNVVTPTQLGSIEFAAEAFGARLVVVLGHSMCGAVLAALRGVESSTEIFPTNLRSVIECVRPTVEDLLETEQRPDRETLVREAVRANVRASVEHLRHGSPVLERLAQETGLAVVGAEYSLESGTVDFFDGTGG